MKISKQVKNLAHSFFSQHGADDHKIKLLCRALRYHIRQQSKSYIEVREKNHETEKLILLAGGISEVAKLMKRSESTIYRWQYYGIPERDLDLLKAKKPDLMERIKDGNII